MKVKRDNKMAIIRNWEESGLSQREFMRREHIKPHEFYYWLRKTRRNEIPLGRNVSNESSRFIRLQAPETEPERRGIFTEIVLVNGTRILFYKAVKISQLKVLTG